jgi:antitoxin (DNA-binding transcriptional repressor) of toxin-antitoxin stability system
MFGLKKNTANLEFYKTQEDVSDIYKPVAAIKKIPRWYKDMGSYLDNIRQPQSDYGTNATVKKCIPVFDAMTSGYLIVLHSDTHFVWNGVDHDIGMPVNTKKYISSHPSWQAEKHPNNLNYMSKFYKYVSPWSLKTPKGYSALFLPPMHHDNFIEILPGIVDTDVYNSPVQLPFVMSRFEEDIVIEAGTPIAQVIPIKREPWVLSESDLSEKSSKTQSAIRSKFFEAYKNTFWSRKSYQ